MNGKRTQKCRPRQGILSLSQAVRFARDSVIQLRSAPDVTTITVEVMFGIFKRGMVGIASDCGEKHL
jgi:hypothetical protein